MRKGEGRRCCTCVARIAEAGVQGSAAWFEHAESEGRIDGKAHRKAGKQTRDRTARAKDADWKRARAACAYFQCRYHMSTWKPDMSRMHATRQGKVWLQPREGWDIGEGETDFITTLRQGLHHEPLQTIPSKNPDEQWAVGTLPDAPFASAEHALRFCSQKPDQYHISSMPESFRVRHEEGTMLWDGEVPVGGRVCARLGHEWCRELARAYYEIRKLRRYCARGGKCAAIARYRPEPRTAFSYLPTNLPTHLPTNLPTDLLPNQPSCQPSCRVLPWQGLCGYRLKVGLQHQPRSAVCHGGEEGGLPRGGDAA